MDSDKVSGAIALSEALSAQSSLIRNLEAVNTGPLRSRKLSLAITALEESRHWLEDAMNDIDATMLHETAR